MRPQTGFYGVVRAVKEGTLKPEQVRPGIRAKVERAAAMMTREQLREYTAQRSDGMLTHAKGSMADARPRNARSA